MKIVDRNTGKRLKETDPVVPGAGKDLTSIENSPMDPPDAYEGGVEGQEKTELPEALKQFTNRFPEINKILDALEKEFGEFVTGGYQFTEGFNSALTTFFKFYDDDLLPFLQLEQKTLFPILHQKLMKSGEHSPAEDPKTAVDIMEDDYVKTIQLGTLLFNFLGLSSRLRDEQARMFVLETAGGNARELIELVRLNIFRKENVLYPLAVKTLSEEEMEELQSKFGE